MDRIKQLKDRWSANTPVFWKKMQKWAIKGAAAGAAMMALPLPVCATIGSYIATGCGMVGIVAQFAKEDGVAEPQGEVVANG